MTDPRRAALLALGALVAAAGGAAVTLGVTGRLDGDERATEVRGAEVTTTTAPTTTAPRSFEQLVEEQRSGIARIEATTCGDATGTGTGFLVDDDHVLTVAHVVDDAAAIAVTFGEDEASERVRVAKVVGYDAVKDVALLQLDRAVDGHVFDLAIEPVRIGTEVAALGFPRGLPLTFTQGRVSGLDRTIEFDDATLTGLVQTDTAINPGNSGGPLLTVDGRVRGLVEAVRRDAQGIAYAVASDTAVPLLHRWRTTPDPRSPADCERPLHEGADVEVSIETDDADAPAIAQALTRYFRAINDGEYDEAWAQHSARWKEDVPRDRFAARLTSSYDFDIVLHAVDRGADDSRVATVTFRSLQRPEDGPRPGESCTDWVLDHTMLREGGRWVIDRSAAHGGGEASVPCSDDEPAVDEPST